MKNNLEFVGFKEVGDALQAVQGILPPGKIEALLRSSANAYIKQAKSNASHHDVTGNLSKSIGSEKDRQIQKSVGILMGPRRSRGFKGHHAHLLEFGTGPRKLNKPVRVKIRGNWVTITHTGTMPATPFLRPAWDSTGPIVLANIKETFGNEIKTGFKKLIK